ncbi:MAG: LuxE/PaaK family acyltransferase [Candidatus Helarchaeota archaeon]
MTLVKMHDYLPKEFQTKYFDFVPRDISDASFCRDLLEQVRRSHENCAYYREKICQRFDFTIPEEISLDNLETIPYIPASIYKESDDRFFQLLKVPKDEIVLYSCSSSTTGDPSIVPRTLDDFDQLQYNAIKLFSEFFQWDELNDSLCFNFSPDRHFMAFMARMKLNNKKHKKLIGPRTRYFTACMNKPWDYRGHQEYLIKVKYLKTLWALISTFSIRGGFVLDVSLMLKMIRKVLKNGEWKKRKINSFVFGGSPLLMNNMFINRLLKENIEIDLDGKARAVCGGGGWDGVKGEAKMDAVDKIHFINCFEKVFNLKTEKIGDIYGFTESPVLFGGHWSEKLQDFVHHCPNHARLIVRSTKNLEPVGVGEEGLLEVITPYGVNGTVNQAVLIDDIVELVSLNKCMECGYEGATFRVIGRLENAQGKSCSSLINWVY